MPGGDRTGPMGAGPRTGRALGLCSGYAAPGYMSSGGRGYGPGFGRGLAWRRGGWGRGGRGWGRWGFPGPYVPAGGESYGVADWMPSAGQERRYLEDQVNGLARQLDALRKRLEEVRREEAEAQAPED